MLKITFASTFLSFSSATDLNLSISLFFYDNLSFISLIKSIKLGSNLSIFLNSPLLNYQGCQYCNQVNGCNIDSDAGKWKKIGGPVVIGGYNLPSPHWNRVSWSAKHWGGGGSGPPGPPGSGITDWHCIAISNCS